MLLPPLTDADLDEMIGVAYRDVAIKLRSWGLWAEARVYLPDLAERPPWAVRVEVDEVDLDGIIG